MEQTGTEVDCGPAGNAVYGAWYELVPARSHTLQARVLPVRPGDWLSASVTVDGGRVTISLYNNTRHKGFRKVMNATAIDVSSAEWIVEAPSGCNVGGTLCVTLPLADFHSATFRSSLAQTSGGHLGSISDGSWQSTRINLLQRFTVHGAVGTAKPSSLHSGGSSFRVTYSRRSH